MLLYFFSTLSRLCRERQAAVASARAACATGAVRRQTYPEELALHPLQPSAVSGDSQWARLNPCRPLDRHLHCPHSTLSLLATSCSTLVIRLSTTPTSATVPSPSNSSHAQLQRHLSSRGIEPPHRLSLPEAPAPPPHSLSPISSICPPPR